MKYVYETTTPFGITAFGTLDNHHIIEHVLVYKFISATDDIDKILKRVGANFYPRQLTWDANGTIILQVSAGPWTLDKAVIICCSELSAEKFERQVLKNNLKTKNAPFNTSRTNNYYNSKEKEKRLLSTKYSK